MSVRVAICLALLSGAVTSGIVHAQESGRRAGFEWRTESKLTLPLGFADLVLDAEVDLSPRLAPREWETGVDASFDLGEYVTLAAGFRWARDTEEGSSEWGPRYARPRSAASSCPRATVSR
jgi:hypothetical protein